MRVTALLLLMCFLGAAMSGCGKKDAIRESSPRTTAERKSETGGGGFIPSEGRSVDVSRDFTKAPAAKAKNGAVESSPPPMAPPATADAGVAREKSPARPAENRLQSGILTAGSFDDNVDPLVFGSFVRRMSQNRGLGDLPDKLAGQRLLIIVKDGAGKPVGDARVKLAAGVSAPVEVTTHSDGRAVFLLSFDQLPPGQSLIATVTPPSGSGAITETIAAGSSRWEITLPAIQAQLPKNLDLAIVLDTTGSMGDELKYLQAELRGIVES